MLLKSSRSSMLGICSALLLNSCFSDHGSNIPPTVSAGRDTTVSINDSVFVWGTASDADGRIALLEWSIGGSPFLSASSPDTVLVAPDSQNLGWSIVLRATDDDGLVATDTAVVRVELDPPTAIVGRDTTVSINDTIYIRGLADDSRGRIALLEWSIGGGPFLRISSPDTVLVAPDSQNLGWSVVLRATDDDGLVAADTAVVRVELDPPTATIDVPGPEVQFGDPLTLLSSRSTPGNFGFIARREWSLGGSPFADASGDTTFTSPSSPQDSFRVILRITDDDGNVASDTAFIKLAPIRWTTRFSTTSTIISSVIWTGGQAVAVGVDQNGGAVLTSPDGITWTARNPGTRYSLNGVTWTGSQLVAVGAGTAAIPWDSTCILTSPDGINWTNRSISTVGSFLDVTWAGNQLVVVGMTAIAGGYIRSAIYTSPDGVFWTPQDSGITGVQLTSVAWTGNQIVVVGIRGTGGGSGAPHIMTSPDGVTWTQNSPLLGGPADLNFVTWTGNQLVVVGQFYGAIETGGLILTSPDGITWTRRISGTTNWLGCVTWNGSQLMAVGTNTVLTSSDGITWRNRQLGIGNLYLGTATWMGSLVPGSPGRFMVAGFNNQSGSPVGVIVTSP